MAAAALTTEPPIVRPRGTSMRVRFSPHCRCGSPSRSLARRKHQQRCWRQPEQMGKGLAQNFGELSALNRPQEPAPAEPPSKTIASCLHFAVCLLAAVEQRAAEADRARLLAVGLCDLPHELCPGHVDGVVHGPRIGPRIVLRISTIRVA
jgi:hypothetical protein